jgi:hypothetical protein
MVGSLMVGRAHATSWRGKVTRLSDRTKAVTNSMRSVAALFVGGHLLLRGGCD